MSLKIDKRCQDLISYFVVRRINGLGPARYNELFEALNDSGMKISRPTLSEHLKHLTDLNYIIRTEISRANVNYQLNSDAAKEFEGYLSISKLIDNYMEENRKKMDSGDIGFHMSNLFTFLVLRQLYQIKYEILKIVEPDRSFEYNIRIHSDLRVWELFVSKYFLDLVIDDEEYRNKALDIVKGLIYCFENADFDPITSLIPADFLANPQ